MINPGVVTGTDPYGREIREDVPEPNVPCRADQITRRIATDANDSDVITQNVLFLSAERDVANNMKIQNIVDLDGNTVLDGSFTVEDINPVYARIRLHHYELTLQKE